MKLGRLFCINKGIIWIALAAMLSVIQVEASEGEPIEENSIPLFDGSAKMDKWNQMYERWESVGTGWLCRRIGNGKEDFYLY